MPILVYPALVLGDRTRGYRAEFPDFAGGEVLGQTSGDMLTAARDWLSGALAQLEREARGWPEPTAVEALAERLRETGAILMLVDVKVDETPVRVNISIGDRLLRRLDEAAQAQTMTRSGFIAAAVRQRLKDAGLHKGPAPDATTQRLFEEVAEVGRRVNEALGPESAFGRTVAELDARALNGLRTLADNFASAVKGRSRPGASSDDGN